jgi:hypothetical protein
MDNQCTVYATLNTINATVLLFELANHSRTQHMVGVPKCRQMFPNAFTAIMAQALFEKNGIDDMMH